MLSLITSINPSIEFANQFFDEKTELSNTHWYFSFHQDADYWSRRKLQEKISVHSENGHWKLVMINRKRWNSIWHFQKFRIRPSCFRLSFISLDFLQEIWVEVRVDLLFNWLQNIRRCLPLILMKTLKGYELQFLPTWFTDLLVVIHMHWILQEIY